MTGILVVGGPAELAAAIGGTSHCPLTTRTAVCAELASASGIDRAVIVALPERGETLGQTSPDAFARLADAWLTVPAGAVKTLAALGQPLRITLVFPASACMPDHRDGARSVVAAGLAMLVEVSSALPGLAVNGVAVADDVPLEEVAAVVRMTLAGDLVALNGATIRLDGGRDAVMAAETRAED